MVKTIQSNRFRGTLMRSAGLLGLAATALAFGAAAQTAVFVNEFHYDNTGADVGEFIEVAGPAGTDLTGWQLVLYNGNGGLSYDTVDLSGAIPDEQAGFGTVAFFRAGIQNGSPDGIALVNAGGIVVQFLSYEGSFNAVDGPAAGMNSQDVGVSEPGDAPIGVSLQLTGSGTTFEDFVFSGPATASEGAINTGQSFDGGPGSPPPPPPPPPPPMAGTTFINELHYDNDGTDVGEFVEIAGLAGTDLTGWEVVLYNGNGGAPYGTIALSGSLPDQQNGVGTLAFFVASNGIQNGGPDGLALVDNLGNVIQFLSYEGTFVAVGGPADGLTSENIGVSESSGTPVGDSLQLTGTGDVFADFVFSGPIPNTAGAVNTGQSFDEPVPPPFVSIPEIQGPGHISPFAGTIVQTSGVVTVVANNGFYLQDLAGDGDPNTSDALFVFTSTAPTVSVLDELLITGSVFEFQPGGAATGNLSITEITNPMIEFTGQAAALPPAIEIGGLFGLEPPTVSIDSDGFSDFNPDTDGIDFYEALEAMRVTLGESVAVAPTTNFGELWVRTQRTSSVNREGGVTISEGDFNPERIQIDDTLYIASGGLVPEVDAGDRLDPVTGVVSYAFGNYEVLAETAPVIARKARNREPMARRSFSRLQLSIATFNVENLDPTDPEDRFDRLATIIADTLNGPDIIAFQEVQDNNGPLNNGVVDASETYRRLIEAISDAGGPDYSFTDIPPVNNQDGGQPGGNIRVGYLYQASRVGFEEDAGDAVTPVSVETDGDRVVLSVNPGRIDPANPAFNNSRKPLVAQFTFNNQDFFLVNNHFTSRGGSSPLFGAIQPPVNAGDGARLGQATAVRDFVRDIQALDPNANVIVLGDLNSFQFEAPSLTIEDGGRLDNLTNELRETDAYTFNFEGNSQALDHILVSSGMRPMPRIDAVHVNSPFSDAVTDHDPMLAIITVPPRRFVRKFAKY